MSHYRQSNGFLIRAELWRPDMTYEEARQAIHAGLRLDDPLRPRPALAKPVAMPGLRRNPAGLAIVALSGAALVVTAWLLWGDAIRRALAAFG